MVYSSKYYLRLPVWKIKVRRTTASQNQRTAVGGVPLEAINDEIEIGVTTTNIQVKRSDVVITKVR